MQAKAPRKRRARVRGAAQDEVDGGAPQVTTVCEEREGRGRWKEGGLGGMFTQSSKAMQVMLRERGAPG